MNQQTGKLEGTFPVEFLGYELTKATTGTEQIVCLFRVDDGPGKGSEVKAYWALTEAALPIAVEALRVLGWDGKDIFKLRKQLVKGTKCNGFFAVESFNGVSRSRLRYLRPLGLSERDALSQPQREDLALRLQQMLDQGKGERCQASAGTPDDDDDDVPF